MHNMIIFKLDGKLHEFAVSSDGTIFGTANTFECPTYDDIITDSMLGLAEYDDTICESKLLKTFSLRDDETNTPASIQSILEAGKLQLVVKEIIKEQI